MPGSVNAVLRVLLSPRWLGRHLLTVGVVVLFVFLGRWQWNRGVVTHSLQNYGYGIQWCLFACVVVYGWGRLLHDDLWPPERTEPVPLVIGGERLDGPDPYAAADDIEDDPDADPEADAELAAYNAYLAQLNARPRR